MKELLVHLQKAFDHRVRLGVMSMLMVNEWVDFTTLRDNLEVSDGNLASHLAALSKEDYVESSKSYAGRRPRTTYRATEAGRTAFVAHLAYLEKLIRRVDLDGGDDT